MEAYAVGGNEKSVRLTVRYGATSVRTKKGGKGGVSGPYNVGGREREREREKETHNKVSHHERP